jgi:hypothetical protein
MSFEHSPADWVLSGVHRGTRPVRAHPTSPAPRAGDHLTPVGMVSLREMREQPLQRAAGSVLNLVGQLDAVGLLPATEKNLGAADDVSRVAPECGVGSHVPRWVSIALRGSMASGSAGHCTMGVECFLRGKPFEAMACRQFLVVDPRQVAKQHRTVDTCGAGVVQDRFFVVAPSVAQPEGDVVARCGLDD